MKPSPRLKDLPFLAATLAMALALTVPWAFAGGDAGEEPTVEVSAILPWAVPDHAAPPLDPSVQLAGQSGPEGSAGLP